MNNSRPSVLVVDDEPDVLMICRLNLEAEGFEVLEADAGPEALTLAREHRPDLVLLDVMLPGMSGWSVLAELKEDETTAAIPVIMLTALVEDHEQRRGWAAGADGYITKPFSPESLASLVAQVLDEDQADRDHRRQRMTIILDDLLDEDPSSTS